MSEHRSRARRGLRLAWSLAAVSLLTSCSESPIDTTPPTIEVARAAASPPPASAPAGLVLPLEGAPEAALYDTATASLVALTPAAGPDGPARLSVLDRSGTLRTVPLPSTAAALAGDGQGTVYVAAQGGFVTVDVAAAAASKSEIAGQATTEFTAIARRSDGRMVLGSADGAVLTLAPDLTVSRRVETFARVDGIAAVGDTAVVLDSGQTSVTALDSAGDPRQALRAGLGATSITADPAGRVLVIDTRGGQLLVFGVDPLIERQAYPVGESPFGVVGSSTWVWVSQTASNTVVGYDLSTGIPVEKVRYPTVRQPNSLAFDDTTGTLYVVSGAGGGVQVIANAGGER